MMPQSNKAARSRWTVRAGRRLVILALPVRTSYGQRREVARHGGASTPVVDGENVARLGRHGNCIGA
jgi:hypothetical protein